MSDTPSWDDMVPDPIVRAEFGVNAMTLWRWDHDERVGFPPKIKIMQRNYRSRRAIEAFKAALLHRAVKSQEVIFDKLRSA